MGTPANGRIGVAVVKGVVHIARDAAGAVKAISIATDEGRTIDVKVDDISKEIQLIENRHIFATGALKDNVLAVHSWFLTSRT